MTRPLFIISFLFLALANPLMAASDEEIANTAAALANDYHQLKKQIEAKRLGSADARGAIRYLRTLKVNALDLSETLTDGNYDDFEEIVIAGQDIMDEFLILSRYMRSLNRYESSVRRDRVLQRQFRLLRAKVYHLDGQINGDVE